MQGLDVDDGAQGFEVDDVQGLEDDDRQGFEIVDVGQGFEVALEDGALDDGVFIHFGFESICLVVVEEHDVNDAGFFFPFTLQSLIRITVSGQHVVELEHDEGQHFLGFLQHVVELDEELEEGQHLLRTVEHELDELEEGQHFFFVLSVFLQQVLDEELEHEEELDEGQHFLGFLQHVVEELEHDDSHGRSQG